jgi:hypothetical protein
MVALSGVPITVVLSARQVARAPQACAGIPRTAAQGVAT